MCARLLRSFLSHLSSVSSALTSRPSAVVASPSSSSFRSTLVPSRHFALSSSRLGGGSGDHVGMWTAERVVSALCIPGMLLPLAMTNPVTDAIFCTLLVVHSHWGEKE